MGGVVSVTSVELLEKPGHANRSERPDEGIDSDAPKLGGRGGAAIDRLCTCIHGNHFHLRRQVMFSEQGRYSPRRAQNRSS